MSFRSHVRRGAVVATSRTDRPASRSSRGWLAFAVLGMLAAAGSGAVQAAPGGNGRRRAHVDRVLTERLEGGDVNRRERVIVTFKRGAKAGKLQQLRALGVRVDRDFGVIDAVSAEMPRGLLTALAEEDDVASISVDADVTSMQTGLESDPALQGRYEFSVNGNDSGPGTAQNGTLFGNQRVVDFAFETMGVHRLEARASTANGRGNGALAKLGATREAVLRQSFERHGERHDQALWSLVRGERRPRETATAIVTH